MDGYVFDKIDVGRIDRTVRGWESSFLSRLPPLGLSEVAERPQIIPFINATGTTIPAWGVVRKTTPTTVDDQMVVNVAKVDATYRWLYIVNGSEDVESGQPGWGTYLSHAGKVLKDTGATPTDGERWGPKADSFLLWQHRPGFWVDGRYDSTEGILWATQIPPGEVRVQNDTGSPIAAGGTGTVNLFGGSAGTTDLGLEIAVTNGSSVSWPSAKYGWVTADAGGLNFVSPYQT